MIRSCFRLQVGTVVVHHAGWCRTTHAVELSVAHTAFPSRECGVRPWPTTRRERLHFGRHGAAV